VDLEKNLLKKIVRGGLLRDALPDEAVKRGLMLFPDFFGLGHGVGAGPRAIVLFLSILPSLPESQTSLFSFLNPKSLHPVFTESDRRGDDAVDFVRGGV
jgi:hypothetical protein